VIVDLIVAESGRKCSGRKRLGFHCKCHFHNYRLVKLFCL